MTKRIFAMVSTEPSKKYTPFAIESFLKFTPLRAGEKLILIDNDGSLRTPQTEFLSYSKPSKPRSFAKNFNWILTQAKKDNADIYFLNNDIIFTEDWILPLESVEDSIITPVSNREFQYRSDGLRLDVSCKLEDYLDNQEGLAKIVQYHKRKFHSPTLSSRRRTISLPFFCVKVPKAVWNKLGPLDEAFGKGGAEDNDYCLRAYQEGFRVEYALESYLLHFSGKSTWDGAESSKETTERDELYRKKFKTKWGEQLLKLSILGDVSPLYSSPELIGQFQQGQFAQVIEKLKSL